MVERIASAVDVLVTMDLQAGLTRLEPLDDAVAAVEAVLRAGRDADRSAVLADAITRGTAFLQALPRWSGGTLRVGTRPLDRWWERHRGVR